MTDISKKGRTILYSPIAEEKTGRPWHIVDADGFVLWMSSRIEDAVAAAPKALIDRRGWVRYLERLEALTHDRLI